MAKLILSLNDSVVGEFPLDKECVTIGRKPENDIPIDNLAISGHHAQVITVLNDSFLEDLDSTNGTFVNSKPVKKHALRNGDVITIGKHQLRYLNEITGQGDTVDAFEKTMIIRPDAVGMPENTGENSLSQDSVERLKEAHAESVRATETSSTPATQGKLQVLNGANAGRELVLTKPLTTLGKPGVQVAAITRRPQGFFVIHVEGDEAHQRPKVNGESIGVSPHRLADHDIIEVAGVKMEFFLEG
jgi:pSer/pThr/pTyr-binding forkhead associated (FHA) protein